MGESKNLTHSRELLQIYDRSELSVSYWSLRNNIEYECATTVEAQEYLKLDLGLDTFLNIVDVVPAR